MNANNQEKNKEPHELMEGATDAQMDEFLDLLEKAKERRKAAQALKEALNSKERVAGAMLAQASLAGTKRPKVPHWLNKKKR